MANSVSNQENKTLEKNLNSKGVDLNNPYYLGLVAFNEKYENKSVLQAIYGEKISDYSKFE